MEVSVPQLAQAVAAARIALTEALVLKVGQVLQALVIGKGSDGLTSLKIGDQVVKAALPEGFAAGTMLQLQVKVGGATPLLAIVGKSPQHVSVTPVSVRPLPAPLGIVSAEARIPGAAAGANIESGQAIAPAGLRLESTPGELDVAVGRSQPGGPQIAVRVQDAVHLSQQPGVERAATEGTSVIRAMTPAPAMTSAGPQPVQPAAQTPVQAAVPSPPAASTPTSQAPVPSAHPVMVAVAIDPVASAGGAVTSAQATAQPVPVNGPSQQAGEPPAPALAPSVQASVAPVPPPGDSEGANPLLLAQTATRSPATMADLPKSAVLSAVTQSQVPARQPPTPQAALAQMLPEAMAKQDSTGPLLISLAALVQKPAALSQPIIRAAMTVLAQRIVAPDGKVLAGDLERAVARSGIGLEAGLAKAQVQPADAKAGLLALRDALARFLGETPASVPARDPAPPPLKGLPLRAPAGDPVPLPDGPRDLARALHSQTDAAVSRIKLMQMASLPDADPARPSAPSLRMELPFLIGHELVMAQIQIARDGGRREAERRRGWTMRFALNFSATGEVGAEVGLLGKAVNVALWAAEPETAVALKSALPELSGALEAIGLKPGSLRIRQGAPEPDKPESGRLLDSVS